MGEGPVKLSVGVRLSNLTHPARKIYSVETPIDFQLTDPSNPAIVGKWMFPHIYPTGTSQQEVYVSMVGPLVEEALVSGNTCCLVYGQPGAGMANTVFGDEGLLEQVLRRVFAEIKNEEKGVKAVMACVEIKGLQATDLFTPSTVVEVTAHMGLFGIQDMTWMNIKSVAEPLNIIKKTVAQRTASGENAGAHNFVLFTISRYKTMMNSISSIVLGEINSFGGVDGDSLSLSLNHTSLQSSSLIVLGKILAELCHESRDDSVLTVKSLNGDWTLALLACITPTVEKYAECLATLNYANKAQSYPAILKKLRKREYREASADDKLILQIRGDIIDLKFDIQQKEFVHNRVLKDLGLKFGLDFDLNLLKDLDVTSREAKTAKILREALERSETYKQVKLVYDERLKSLASQIEEAKAQTQQNTRRRNIELQAYEDRLREAQDKVSDVFPELSEAEKSEIESLQTQLDSEKNALMRVSTSIADLHGIAVVRAEAAENETMERRSGRDAVDALYRKEYRDAEKSASQQLSKLEQELKDSVRAKDKLRIETEQKMRIAGMRKAAQLENLRRECCHLSWAAKQLHDLIESIKRGDFNHGVVPIMIPRGHQPEFPWELVEKQYETSRPAHNA